VRLMSSALQSRLPGTSRRTLAGSVAALAALALPAGLAAPAQAQTRPVPARAPARAVARAVARPPVAHRPAGQVPASRPARGTPAFPPVTQDVEQVRQLVQCGSRMYAVGRFSQVKWHGRTFTRNNAFSFLATAPFTMSSWNPDVNGEVNSIAFSGGCGSAFLGGSFSSVQGARAANIAKVSTATGRVVTRFGRRADAPVLSLVASHGHLLAGGQFKSVNGSADSYLASLSTATGRDDGFARLNISGRLGDGRTKIYNQQVSHDGRMELAEGTFTSVGGQRRQQIVMLRLTGRHVTVTDWTSPEFFAFCQPQEQFWLRSAAWSPDDRTVYVATTGFRPAFGPPNSALCDAAAAFPATHTFVRHLWINYTGCDSLFATAATSRVAFFAGHERWADNRFGCNERGPGAVDAPGMVGLSPRDGEVVYNPTRSRGLGADDMLVTRAGLWIASDNAGRSTTCGRSGGHAGICFLPFRR
jgi:hypothetical protein